MIVARAAGEVGAVALGAVQLYAYFEHRDGGGWRVRVSLDEYDGLGLHPFQWVQVGLPRRGEGVMYFAGLREQPPFAWLDLRPAPAAGFRPAPASPTGGRGEPHRAGE